MHSPSRALAGLQEWKPIFDGDGNYLLPQKKPNTRTHDVWFLVCKYLIENKITLYDDRYWDVLTAAGRLRLLTVAGSRLRMESNFVTQRNLINQDYTNFAYRKHKLKMLRKKWERKNAKR